MRKKLESNNVNTVLLLVGSKWKLLIINELLKNNLRFVELKKKLGCTAKILTKCLKDMENDGLVLRNILDSKALKVEYSLTDLGYTLFPVIEAMQKWGKEYKRFKTLLEKQKQLKNNGEIICK